MKTVRLPSPARSQGAAPRTPIRRKHRRTLSVGSARSNASGRLTAIIQQNRNMESFVLSPLANRSVLSDNTEIEEPKRNSWWKKLDENSRNVTELFEENKVVESNNIIEELDIEVLSQENKNYTMDLPESSDSESINSIVIPQRKLFTQKENLPQKKFGEIIGTRETLAKLNKTNKDKTINVATRELFQNKQRSKPIFPAALLNISLDKTGPEKIKELTTVEPKAKMRNLFDNRATKRKNIFTNFIVSESEDDIPDIKPKVFGFKQSSKTRRSSSRGIREPSPASSITTDIEMEDWNMLPSSTMVEHQLEVMITGKPNKTLPSKVTEESDQLEISQEKSNHSLNMSNKSQAKDDSKVKTDEIEVICEQTKQPKKASNISEYKNEENVMEVDENLQQEIVQNQTEVLNESNKPYINQQVDGNAKDMVEINVDINEQVDVIEQNEVKINDDKHQEVKASGIEVNDKNTVANNSQNEVDVVNNRENEDEIEDQQFNFDLQSESEELDKEIENDEELNQSSDVQDKSRIENVSQETEDESEEELQYESEAELNESQIEAENEEEQQNMSHERQDQEVSQAIEKSDNDYEEHNNSERVETENEDEEQNISQKEQDHEESEAIADSDNDERNNSQGVETENEDVEQNMSCEGQDQEESEAIDESDNDNDGPNNSEVEAENEDEEQNMSQHEEQEDSKEQIESEVEDQEENEAIPDSDNDNEPNNSQGDIANDSDNQQLNEIENIQEKEVESPNISHDTTGRNRKKNESPEVILHDSNNHLDSFAVQGRNTSVRKTEMIKSMNLRPSLAPVRESTGFSDNGGSSSEGSGWDSHRTTRKTLRQTFGRDITLRKSLRALVMEKSAKRQTHDIEMTSVTTKFPEANSTELPEMSNQYDDHHECDENDMSKHAVSPRTRQMTLDTYLQDIKKKNTEARLKMEEAVRNSLNAPSKDHIFKVPAKPFFARRPKAPPKQKQAKSTLFSGELPTEVIEDLKYKPPKRFQPSNAPWITKRLYKFLETKLESKYDYKARVRAEKLVESIYHFSKELRRHNVASTDAVDVLKREMARLDVVNTHFEFYEFFHQFMPREVRVKVVPDVVNKISLPRQGVFSNIL